MVDFIFRSGKFDEKSFLCQEIFQEKVFHNILGIRKGNVSFFQNDAAQILD